ncbi:MAG TPA: tetratricopeptide repeat protein, partial [Candidatus Eisenbacteria bacterium]
MNLAGRDMVGDATRGLEKPERSLGFRLGKVGPPVFIVALVIRLVYLVGYQHNPFFADPQMDALYHDRWAAQIARGDWLGSEVFFRAPLYAYFLGAVYFVSDHSYWFVRIVQAVIGALSCVLVARIGRRLFGPVTGFVAGIMAAFLATSVYYEADLLLVVLETFLGLLALERVLAVAEVGGRPGALAATFAAGLVLGLAAITRPNFLVLAPVFLGYLLVHLRRHGRAVWGAALWLYLAGLAAPISVVTVRNYVVGEDFVPIASQGGLNFYLGNNPSADGMAALAPEFRPTWYGGVRDATRLAEEGMGRPLKSSEVSDYWFARGLSWVVSRPAAAFGLFVRKFGYFWGAFEIPNNEDFYFFSRYSILFRWPLLFGFGAVTPLALAGLVHAWRRRRFPTVLAAGVTVYSLSIVLFFVCGRFRAPIVPWLVVPAAFLIVDAASLARRHEWRGLGPAALALALALWIVHSDPSQLRAHHTFAESYLRLGIVDAAKGKSDAAEAAYRSAIDADPRFAEGHNNLGVLLMQSNRSREALEEFERAYAIDPDYPRTLNNLAAWYEHEGDLGRARGYIDRALGRKGDEVEILYNAGIILGRQGDFTGSAAHFRRLIEIEPTHQAARLGLGKSLFMAEKYADAGTAFDRVLENDPRHVEALYFLGLSRARL